MPPVSWTSPSPRLPRPQVRSCCTMTPISTTSPRLSPRRGVAGWYLAGRSTDPRRRPAPKKGRRVGPPAAGSLTCDSGPESAPERGVAALSAGLRGKQERRWASSSRSTAVRRSARPSGSSASPNGSWPPARTGTTWSSSSRRWATPPTNLMDLAQQVSPAPPARELDMLLTSGERISNALVAMAISALGAAGAVVHRIAGRRHHRLRPRQGPDHRRHPRPDPGRAGQGAHRAGRRLPGRQPGHQGHHHAGSRRLGHHRRRAGRGAARRRLRDLHGRRRRLHRRPADRVRRRQAGHHHLRGDARDGGVRREGADAALRRVRPPVRRPGARPVLVQRSRRHHRPRQHGGSDDGTGTDHRRRARTRRGQGHRHRGARPPRGRREDLPRHRRRGDRHRHGGAEHLQGGRGQDGHHLHAAQGRRPDAPSRR